MSSDLETNGKDEGGEIFPLLSFVVMNNTEFPSEDELAAAIKKRIPEFEHTKPDAPQDKLMTITGTIEGKMCAIMMIDAQNPISPDDSFIQSAWWWPEVMDEMEKRKSHAVVSVMADQPVVADHTLLARLTAAIAQSNDATAVIWNGADAIWKAEMFVGMLDHLAPEPPFDLFVSVKLGRDTEFPAPGGAPAWLGMTCGLAAFGLMEIEVRGFSGDTPEQMIQIMQNTASYLLSSGPVINDGDSIGPDEQTRITIAFEDSTLMPDAKVYRAHFNKAEGA